MLRDMRERESESGSTETSYVIFYLSKVLVYYCFLIFHGYICIGGYISLEFFYSANNYSSINYACFSMPLSIRPSH